MECLWPPHITVACIVEHKQRYLMIEEYSQGRLVFNQPAGHLDPGETLLEAAVRETLEESGWHVEPTHVLGVSRYTAKHSGVVYYRTTFIANALREEPNAELDEGIERACWLTYEELCQHKDKLRSPLVLRSIEKYRAGIRYPLTLIDDYELE